jgi:hypothetical protein
MCGQVSFRVSGALGTAVGCHCKQCRKGSGHFVVATSARTEQLEITGDVTWFAYKPGVERGFCGVCGSQLFWRNHTDASVSIMMGAFDEPTGLTIAGHIYTDAKGSYYDLPSDLPSAQWDDPSLTSRL